MEIRILGHRLTVEDDAGEPIDISRGQVRELICVLAVEHGSAVSGAALVERLWDPSGKDTAKSLKQAVYNARQVLPEGRLRTERGGYRLHLADSDYLDFTDFRRLTDRARTARDGAPRDAAGLYERALSLVGAPPLGDLPRTVGMEPLRQSLLGGLLDAREELAETLLQLHDFRKVIGLVTRWLADDPLNEHLRGLLMLALSGAGRRSEALRVYRDVLDLLGPDARPGGWLESVAERIDADGHEDAWSPRPVWLATEAHRPDSAGIDTTRPSPARVYDCLLGGKDNFAVDREAASALIRNYPPAPQVARVNRAFVIRAVRYLVEAGITQFVDIGTGLPTLENVHDVARRTAPDARVLYVDSDPMVCAYGRALLATDDGVGLIQADASRPKEILEHPTTRRLIDFDRPVAILLATVMHFVPDHDDPHAVVRAYVDALPPGGCLAVSHSTVPPGYDARLARENVAPEVWGRSGMYPRDRAAVARFFDGLSLVEPGRLVDAPDWRPDLADGEVEPGLACYWVGVARKEAAPLT